MRDTYMLQKVSLVTRLEVYRRLNDLTYQRLGELLGRTQPQAVRYCKPQTDPGHNVPHWSVGETLKTLTHGIIDLGNYADELTPAEAADMMAEIARREAAAKAGEVSRG